MTSPYLNRPSRSLPEALRERGLTPDDIGANIDTPQEECSVTAKSETGLANRPYGRAVLIGICVISVIWIALIFVDGQSSGMTPVDMEAEAERLENNIMPAAGRQ